MEDVQMHPASVPLRINRVGVKNLQLPIVILDRDNGRQHTTAAVTLSADLPSSLKGTHMSRFVEAVQDWEEDLNYNSVKRLLEGIKERLGADIAYASFTFPYFIRKQAPVTNAPAPVCYTCCLTGELEKDTLVFTVQVEVPVMTVCPCSKAISDEGAHSQRTLVRVQVKMNRFSWLEEFIDIAEAAGSSPTYTLLKREDEKYVTEQAFAHPTFVEDVVRAVAHKLSEHPHVDSYAVEVESLESIHCHNAFAYIEQKK